ncbi:MAG: LemA family protein [Clostridia bacterium]|nr:LemA family protein [Clostridia bacterium]
MVVFLIVIIALVFMYIRNVYLKEFIEVTVIYKSLCKLLNSRDLLLLKILPDIKNKKQTEKILTLIDERNKKSKISYDDAILADVELHNELKSLYSVIEKMKKNELQTEIFKKIISFENQIKNVRKKYSFAVEKYNMSLTIHPKFCIKFMHMKPLEIYGNATKK